MSRPLPPQPRIACIGEAMVELSALNFAERTAALGVAGDVYNTAVYLARAMVPVGGSVDFVTALGRDTLSDAMIAVFDREGLGTGLVPRHPTRNPGLYSIQVDTGGERAFTYWRAQSAARCLFGEIGPDLTALAGFDAVFLSAITLAILPEPVAARLTDTCAELKSKGTAVIFDSNYRPRLWPGEATARAAMDRMWHATTIALPSLDDEAALHPGLTEQALACRIADLGPEEIVLKRGPRGPLVLAGRKMTDTDFPPATDVVDTTAAGDSFNAGYLAARAGGADPVTAARAGHDLACRVIGISGAIAPRDAGE